LGGKRLGYYDVVLAMESKHRDYVLSLCPECESKVVVWNVKDPYFMDREDAWKIYEQIKEKVTETSKTIVKLEGRGMYKGDPFLIFVHQSKRLFLYIPYDFVQANP